MFTDILKFLESFWSNPSLTIVIAEAIALIFLVRFWIKLVSRKLDKVLTHQVYETMERRSMDSALDKCLPANGKSYREHKQDEMDKLTQELADKELIAKKKTFFEL